MQGNVTGRRNVNQSRAIWRALTHVRRAGVAIAMTLTFVVCMALGIGFHTPLASADESQPSSGSAAMPDPTVTLTIDKLTPIVTQDSGLSAQVTIANHTDERLEDGVLALYTNLQHAFTSRTEVQQWADDDSRIPVPDGLESVSVPEIDANGTQTVTIDVGKDDDALQSIATWGPRPLAVEYSPTNGAPIVSRTFFTRSWDGLDTQRTPQLNMTVVMPLSSTQWQVNTNAQTQLIKGNGDHLPNPASVVNFSDSTQADLRAKAALGARYPQLQTIADPLVLRSVSDAHIEGLMQMGAFDMTAYTQLNDTDLYAGAGIDPTDWNAHASLHAWRTMVGDNSANRNTYAWQGNGVWTYDALSQARSQGYTTVIATHNFENLGDNGAHTSVYSVPTDNGEVQVLAAQPVLTKLASGSETSRAASAEKSVAGRVARFMAQSAFYQMEQPYMERNTLVCMGANTSAREVSEIMAALHNASWLNITDLSTLEHSEPLADGLNAVALLPESEDGSSVDTTAVTAALESLRQSRVDVQRFTDSILDVSGKVPTPSPSSSPSPDASTEAGNADSRGSAAKAWGEDLLQAHNTMALLAMDGNNTMRNAMTRGASDFASTLLNAVNITSSNSINVVSETATMPVTVSNSLPFPVDVKVSSITNSMEIVTSRMTDAVVPAHGEAQVVFKVRVSTAGSTIATEKLLDRDGRAFSSTKYTTITSALQISDKSGSLFIIIAFVLGALGLWRQFHRKKDPDE